MRNLRFLWLALLLVIIPATSFAGVVISVNIAPPVLPVYTQPPCPGDGYIWTPGYWAYGPEGYYWVPGTWVTPPTVGVLWTPGYWGWGNGVYIWHAGYWGPHIGFYGGVNYGFGYFGHGYEGGYWRDRHFYYNRTVNNVNITNVHIYNKTVVNNVTVNRISYNGGHGGINARPTREQETWGREHHFEATNMQRDHEHAAGRDRGFLASENHGRPAVAATERPGEFHGPRVVPARTAGGSYGRPENRSVPRPQGNPHNDRPMAREPMHGGPAPRPDYSAHRNEAPRPDYNAHRNEAPRPGNYRQENAGPRDNGHGHDNAGPHGNDGPHENAPRQERQGHADHGHEGHPR
jgi:YXWGXW repeat-containing protein